MLRVRDEKRIATLEWSTNTRIVSPKKPVPVVLQAAAFNEDL